MMLPENLKIISAHEDSCLFNFTYNQLVYFTLSSTGDINEINIDNASLTSKIRLERPCDDFLSKNNHLIKPRKVGTSPLIMSYEIISYGNAEIFLLPEQKLGKPNFLILGYDDGLILVWKICEEQASEFNETPKGDEDFIVNSMKGKLKRIEEERHDTINSIQTDRKKNDWINEKTFVNKTSEFFIANKNTFDLQDERLETQVAHSYDLDLVLIGHSSSILCFNFIAGKGLLISSSDDHTLKVWSLAKGISFYTFNLDISLNLIYCQTNIKSGEGTLYCFSKEPFLLKLNLSKEPLNFQSKQFHYPNLTCYLDVTMIFEIPVEDPKAKKNDKAGAKSSKANQKPVKMKKVESSFVLFGNMQGKILIFNSKTMELDKEISSEKLRSGILQMHKYNNYFVLVCNDNKAYFCEIAFDTGILKVNFFIQVSEDHSNFSTMIGKEQLSICSEDRFAYMLNLKREIDLFNRRTQMIKEEEESVQMNIMYLKMKEKKKRKIGSAKKQRPDSIKSNGKASKSKTKKK